MASCGGSGVRNWIRGKPRGQSGAGRASKVRGGARRGSPACDDIRGAFDIFGVLTSDP